MSAHLRIVEAVDEDATTNRVVLTPPPALWRILVAYVVVPILGAVGLAAFVIMRWPR